MNNAITKALIEQGYAIIDNGLEKKLIDNIKSNINESLIAILKEGDLDSPPPMI